jgi:immunity protein 42 of polymorphic toxin system
MIGNASVLAIESSITLAYERLSFRALGFFVIHVAGRSYGRRLPDSTLLACSYDEVGRRIAMRGSHNVAFATEPDAGKIADAFLNAIYAKEPRESHFGIPLSEFSDMIQLKRIVWAPDGDEAFDDGSYVLQFDVQDRVRLIAFKSGHTYLHDPDTLRDIWLAAEEFYHVLERWHDAFESEWVSTPKASDAGVK